MNNRFENIEISTQVLSELYNVLTRKKFETQEDAQRYEHLDELYKHQQAISLLQTLIHTANIRISLQVLNECHWNLIKKFIQTLSIRHHQPRPSEYRPAKL